MHRVPPPFDGDGWKGTYVSVEVSAYWEDGIEPERFARYMLAHHFGIRWT